MRAIYERHYLRISHLRFSISYIVFPYALVWNKWASLKNGIKLIEDVQRRSTKLVKGLQNIEYKERAQLLNLVNLDLTA